MNKRQQQKDTIKTHSPEHREDYREDTEEDFQEPNLEEPGTDFDESKKPDNVKDHVQYIEDFCDYTKQNMDYSKKLAEHCRVQRILYLKKKDEFLSEMNNQLTTNAAEIGGYLKMNINGQMDENAQLQKEIGDLTKENSQLKQLIIMVGKRLQSLENAVGSYGQKLDKEGNKIVKPNNTMQSTTKSKFK